MIAMIGVEPQANSTWLVAFVMDPEDGENHTVKIQLSRVERVWLAFRIVCTLLKR